MLVYRLFLTAEERQTLEGWQKKYKSHSPKLQRIQILLNSDEYTGRRPAPNLAAVLGVSTKTVERVRRQFCEQGLALFEPKPQKTRSDKKIDGRWRPIWRPCFAKARPMSSPAGNSNCWPTGWSNCRWSSISRPRWWRGC